MLAAISSVNGQEYQKHHEDLTISLNYAMIESAISKLSNTAYSGKYVHGGMICSSPRATITTSTINFKTEGDVLGSKGDTRFTTKGTFGVGSKLTRCGSWSIGASCQATSQFTDLTKKGRIGGLCVVRFGRFGFPFFIGDTIDPVVKEPPVFPIKLKNTKSISMEFGKWENNKWVTAQDKHNKTVSYWADIGATTSQAIPSRGPIKGELLEMDVSIGDRYYITTDSRDEYRKHYLQTQDFDIQRDLFQLRIDQSLFLKQDNLGNKSGLLGEFFPLRVTGELDGNEIDVVLDGASVKYGTLNNEKVIVIGTSVKSVSSGAFIEEAEGLVTLAEPRMEGNELVTYIERFELNMETKCLFLSFCISGSLLEHFDTDRLVIATLSGKMELEVPNCIEMDNNRWEPDNRLCPDGTIGRQDNSNKSTRVIPLFDKTKVDISDYAMTITVPAQIEHYNPPRKDLRSTRLPDDLRRIAENIKIPESEYNQGTEEDYMDKNNSKQD